MEAGIDLLEQMQHHNFWIEKAPGDDPLRDDDLGMRYVVAKLVAAPAQGPSDRTVKNWFAGTCGPSGQHLIAIIRHSDAVFEAVMLLAGRNELAAAKKLADARDTLVAMLEIIVDLRA